ncbi:MAG: hypothetical protein K2L00_05895 [Muribaculaceae bacterium]|nr:hypothetical protein [Muribaculaceae bacterium]
MEQIHYRDYAGRYGMDVRRVCLIGANYIEDKERLVLEWRIEWVQDRKRGKGRYSGN